jgi:hypothetical protein
LFYRLIQCLKNKDVVVYKFVWLMEENYKWSLSSTKEDNEMDITGNGWNNKELRIVKIGKKK